MAAKPRSKRWRYFLGVFGFLVVVVAAFVVLAAKPEYGFLDGFGSARRSTSWLPSGERCYSFRSSFEEVLPAAKRDFRARGWRIDYEDPLLVIFLRNRHGHAEEAVLAARDMEWNSRMEPELTRSMVWLPYEPTWMEKEIAFVKERVGWAEKVTPTNVLSYQTGFSYSFRLEKVAGKVSMHLLLRNLNGAPVTARIDLLDYLNYEPEETFPVPTVIAARSFREFHFTYPAEAFGTDGELLTFKYSLLDPPNEPFTSEQISLDPEPDVGTDISDNGSDLIMKVANEVDGRAKVGRTPYARDYELRKLVFSIDGEVVKSLPGPMRIKPGTSLSFPIKLTEEASPEIKFQFRLLPNKRWREYEMSGD